MDYILKKTKLFSLERGQQGSLRFQSRGRNYTRYILYIFLALVAIFFIILSLRLFQLTVVKGSYYRGLSENNRVKEIVIEAKRGALKDRYGRVLVESKEADYKKQAERIVSTRKYYDPEIFAHVVGYRQIADEKDLKKQKCINKLDKNDKTGKKGVEKLYDCYLRGKNGKKLIEVDAMGDSISTLSVLEPEAGSDITLSLDADLQKKSYEEIKGKKAVVVALKPDTGEVMAMASWPSYNPQYFEDNKGEEIKKYFKDEDKPLFNRATEGVYPPGSVYKMTVTTAALEEGVVTANTLIEDTGVIEIGPAKYYNWYYLKYGATDKNVNAVKALQRSNDIYYYKVGEKLTPEKIKAWSVKMGFEQKTGIGIAEASGTIPSPFWKEEVLQEDWFTGDTYNMSIGQGYTLVTPLQIAVVTAVYANEGNLCKPQLSKIGGNKGVEDLQNIKPDCKQLPISDSTLKVIDEGMLKACQSGGTGVPFFDYKVRDPELLAKVTPTPSLAPDVSGSQASPSAIASGSAQINIMKPITVACKTGTAESFGDGSEPHAWFTVFAPAENPEIVLTVMAEEAGEGSEVAAPIAKEILTDYFERKKR
jgi:penicillin-binding protein 2